MIGQSDDQLRAMIDRVIRLKQEQDTLAWDIREVYAEAKSSGFDKTMMGKVVAHLRKLEKAGAKSVEEQESLFAIYLDAYNRAGTEVAIAHAHEGKRIAAVATPVPHDPETGEIADPVPVAAAPTTGDEAAGAEVLTAPVPAADYSMPDIPEALDRRRRAA